jgi:hypothetical protein
MPIVQALGVKVYEVEQCVIVRDYREDLWVPVQLLEFPNTLLSLGRVVVYPLAIGISDLEERLCGAVMGMNVQKN